MQKRGRVATMVVFLVGAGVGVALDAVSRGVVFPVTIDPKLARAEERELIEQLIDDNFESLDSYLGGAQPRNPGYYSHLRDVLVSSADPSNWFVSRLIDELGKSSDPCDGCFLLSFAGRARTSWISRKAEQAARSVAERWCGRRKFTATPFVPGQ